MILYTLTAYCSVCGHDVAESDDEDVTVMLDGLTKRAETLYAAHVTEYGCTLS
jgi:archaellum component FlaG (FlaF/FlaG flagellin family)